ncbi:MAG: DNA polymerase III subunit delta [Candidatus Margulisiibacteriota bacterium]|jgi:DNA polymerase-3 subunit delta
MPANLFLLFGTEGVLISEELGKLKTKHGLDELNIDVIEGASAEINDLAQALQSAPMLFSMGKKMVLIKDYPLFRTVKKAAEDEEEETDEQDEKTNNTEKTIEQLIELLTNIPDDIIAVFTYLESAEYGSSRKVDKRKKLFKAIQKLGEVREFSNFEDRDKGKLMDWIRERVRLEGKAISPDAAIMLSETAGNHLSLLSGEINKLVTYIGDRPAIGPEDVLLMASSGQAAAFALINALRDRKAAPAMKALKRMLYDGENEVALLMRIANQFRTMLLAKSLQQKKLSQNEIAAQIGANPYMLGKMLPALQKFTLQELLEIMQIIAEADYRFKSGQMGKEVLLEMLIVDICGGTKGSLLLESVVN